MRFDAPKFLPGGDHFIMVQFGDDAEIDLNFLAPGLTAALKADATKGVVDTNPSYNSLVVEYEADEISYGDLESELRRLIGGLGNTLEDTARLVRDEMDPLKRDFIGLGEWILWPVIKWLPFRWMKNLFRNLVEKKKKVPPLPPQVSNGGLFPISLFRLGDVKIKDIWFGGGLIRVPNFQFNFFGVDETLVFSVSHFDSIIDPALVNEVFEKVEEELTEGTAGHPPP